MFSTFAVTTKRLHDLDYAGWWLLPCFVLLVALSVVFRLAMPPQYGQGLVGLVSIIGLLWLGCKPGVQASNRFGDDPSYKPLHATKPAAVRI
jgi:uncharacterized membrane protein YhaH (DUF805 family)